MGLKLKQRAFLGGEIRLPGHEVAAQDEGECRAYPSEVWEESVAAPATPEPKSDPEPIPTETAPTTTPAKPATKRTRGRGRG